MNRDRLRQFESIAQLQRVRLDRAQLHAAGLRRELQRAQQACQASLTERDGLQAQWRAALDRGAGLDLAAIAGWRSLAGEAQRRCDENDAARQAGDVDAFARELLRLRTQSERSDADVARERAALARKREENSAMPRWNGTTPCCTKRHRHTPREPRHEDLRTGFAAAARARHRRAPRGQERGPFQQLVQRLEQDMVRRRRRRRAGIGAAPRAGTRAPLAAAAPAVVRPLAYLRDPDLPAGGAEPRPQYGLRDIVEASAAAPALAMPAAAAATATPPRSRPSSRRRRRAWASARRPDRQRRRRRHACLPREPRAATRGIRRRPPRLLAAPGGFGLALRLREDRPLDADLLRRALARVLHEHGARLMRLTIDGTDASLFQEETPHGD
ncbi:hypothetical protein FE772_22625 [Lysobacter enzymogenes]|nr:hypothetical protein [Lysobacter enzymogenes]QCW28021.1 hypothetical protein FE772_22625 [Lysobacter enzymogenes]